MQKRWAVWATVGAAAAIAVTAAALIGYAVATHSEAGLLSACQVGGRAVYTTDVEGSASSHPCADPHEVRWPRDALPLSVHVALASEGTVGRGDVERAVDDFNAQLGFDLFVVHSDGDSAPNVFLTANVASEDGSSPGECSHALRRGDGLVESAGVTVRNVGDVVTAHRIILHELGHVAGLAHDDFESSLMFWRTVDVLESPTPIGRLTDADRETLREIYGPRR